MTTTFPTEEMMQERGAALLRIWRQHRDDENRLRREMEVPVWKDWLFWLGFFFLGAKSTHDGNSQPWLMGLVIMIVALDRVARRRARAAKDFEKLQDEKKLLSLKP
ncbi:MAG: hypothetical protein RLZZ476_124 [Verrucomicrobiota bacterium]|jgi:hypothetical protein